MTKKSKENQDESKTISKAQKAIVKRKEMINKIMFLIKKGNSKEKILSEFRGMKLFDFDEDYSMAKARLANLKSKKLPNNFFFTEDDLRWATHQEVAEYRAKRLACSVIVDVGCGIGIQSIAFSKTCKKVIGIDINPKKIELAKMNANAAKAENIEFICADALVAADKIEEAYYVFCDPQRPDFEPSRMLSSLQPDMRLLMEKFKRLTTSFCIELPPQIKEFPDDCEKEYISVNHDLNRLNAYFGKLKKADISVCVLPSEEKLSSENEEQIFAYASAMEYIYEPDDAVEKAQLVNKIPAEGLFFFNDYLTSEKLIKSYFLKSCYKVLGTVSKEKSLIGNILKKHQAGKAILHGKIPPDQYWPIRKGIEAGLAGEKQLHVFMLEDEAIVCEKLY